MIVRIVVAAAGFISPSAARRYLSRRVADTQTRYRVRKFITYAGWVLATLFVLAVLYDRLPSMQLTAGLIGAGVSFALREVIVSLAGWAAVSLSEFYEPGDRVELGGIMGDVIDIGMLRTTLMECGAWIEGDKYSGRIVRVANSFIFTQPVFNYSAEFPFLWDEIQFPVRQGSDKKLARDILARVATEVTEEYLPEANKDWHRMRYRYLLVAVSTSPQVTISADERWMTFTVRYVVDYRERRSTKDKIVSGVLEEFAATAGHVALAVATTEITVHSVPTLNIKEAAV
jgi:small-conductance mechanosensitive channel